MSNNKGEKQLTNEYGFIKLPDMKTKYTTDEWKIREQEYMDSLNSISIPFDPDDADIMALNSMIDQVYSVAKIEQAIYKRLYEKYYRQRKNYETEVYIIVKRNLPVDANGNPEKKTEAEMKGLGIEYLKNKLIDNSNYSIYQMVDLLEDRMIFMDAVVDILKNKSDKLITDSGALKLSMQFNGNQSGRTA